MSEKRYQIHIASSFSTSKGSYDVNSFMCRCCQVPYVRHMLRNVHVCVVNVRVH